MIQLHTVQYSRVRTYREYEKKEGRGQDEGKEEENGQGGSVERGRNGKMEWDRTVHRVEG
jgi:hypothetical protein